MSEENVELVRRYFANTGDLVELIADDEAWEAAASGVREIVDPDFQVRWPGDVRASDRGVEGFREGWRDWLSGWESFTSSIDELREIDDDRVLGVGVSRGRTAHDAVEIETPSVAIFTFRDGKLWRIEYFLTRAEGLEAAGLQE